MSQGGRRCFYNLFCVVFLLFWLFAGIVLLLHLIPIQQLCRMTGEYFNVQSAWARAEFPMLQKNEVGWQGAGATTDRQGTAGRLRGRRRALSWARYGQAAGGLAPWQETCPRMGGCEASVCGTTWQLQNGCGCLTYSHALKGAESTVLGLQCVPLCPAQASSCCRTQFGRDPFLEAKRKFIYKRRDKGLFSLAHTSHSHFSSLSQIKEAEVF